MKLDIGTLVQWINDEGRQTVWMITEDGKTGVVLHSEGVVQVGSLMDLSKQANLTSFIGTVNLTSSAKEA